MRYPESIEQLIDRFRRLPGVGPKSAERYALSLLRQPREEITALIEQLAAVRDRIGRCGQCGMLSNGVHCAICGDQRRDHTVLCVVAEMPDLLAIERTGEFRGLYHILDGLLAPIEGVGPEQLRIRELLERVQKDFSPSRRGGAGGGGTSVQGVGQSGIAEIIFAFDPTIEGETTVNYLAQQLNGCGARLTKIARGLPVGGDLEYADPITLSDSLTGRRELPTPRATVPLTRAPIEDTVPS